MGEKQALVLLNLPRGIGFKIAVNRRPDWRAHFSHFLRNSSQLREPRFDHRRRGLYF